MNKILIKNVKHIEQDIVDVLIDGKIISQIGNNIDVPADKVIDGTDKAILPSFYNSHTHSGMSIMRGAADDMELFQWLNEHIWPLEKLRIDEDVYNAVRFACLEMIKSGTTFFSDMYEFFPMTLKATEDMGMKAFLGPAFFDFGKEDLMALSRKKMQETFELAQNADDKIGFSVGAHAIYTVCEESLKWIRDFAVANGVPVHMHISETEKEVDDCVKEHGLRPVEYLESIGFFEANVFAAHSVWLTDDEMKIFRDNNVKAIHNPCSNQKLASGTFDFKSMKNEGVKVLLGTDSVASNNNLDMFEEMRSAALLAKLSSKDPTVCPASEIFDVATVDSASAYGIDGGVIAEGKVADCMLVDLNHYLLNPGWNLMSDVVYSANSACVDTVICDGKILMENQVVPGETEIIEKAREFMNRVQKDFK
ncbi:MAG: amidohydrolase [Kiritimatiellae bacterium]|jgi:5-methylthioadenosine/S-adenosylhomocysteine deaminase|nr:amidohydrolase [Kiritimatiellia bacterium]